MIPRGKGGARAGAGITGVPCLGSAPGRAPNNQFTNGRSQAVGIPEKLRFEGKEVTIRRLGDGVLLVPVKAFTWPEGFFNSIRIDEPNFTRPDQGEHPPSWTSPHDLPPRYQQHPGIQTCERPAGGRLARAKDQPRQRPPGSRFPPQSSSGPVSGKVDAPAIWRSYHLPLHSTSPPARHRKKSKPHILAALPDEGPLMISIVSSSRLATARSLSCPDGRNPINSAIKARTQRIIILTFVQSFQETSGPHQIKILAGERNKVRKFIDPSGQKVSTP